MFLPIHGQIREETQIAVFVRCEYRVDMNTGYDAIRRKGYVSSDISGSIK